MTKVDHGNVVFAMATATAVQTITPITVGPVPSVNTAPECGELDMIKYDITTGADASTTSTITIGRGRYNLYSRSSACIPTQYKFLADKSANPVFSPGTACPNGYEPMCTSVYPSADNVGTALNVQAWPILTSGQVAIGCCPSGYKCATEWEDSYTCTSTLARNETLTVAFAEIHTRVIITADEYNTAVIRALRLVYMSGPPTPTSTLTPTATSTPEVTQTAQLPHAQGLSTGQKAAIGVCVSVLVLALLLLAVFLFIRHRRRQRGTSSTAEGGASDEAEGERYSKPELDGSYKPELDAPWPDGGSGGNTVSSGPLAELPSAVTEGRQNLEQEEVAELPGCDVMPSQPLPGRMSPIIRRKPVAGSPEPADDGRFSLVSAESDLRSSKHEVSGLGLENSTSNRSSTL